MAARRASTRRSSGLLAALAMAALAMPAQAQDAKPQPPATAQTDSRISLRHFDHLYAEREMGGETVGIVNIYGIAPDFRFGIEPNEGYTCVDDVARAMVLLASAPQLEPGRLRQLELMTRFVVRMQAENGYFHNFLWGDGRINREYRTSLAELNWWSLRALWGLEAALQRLPADSATARRARAAADHLVVNLKRDLPAGRRTMTVQDGLSLPTWLPFGSGADAASTAVLGLIPHYRRTRDAETRALIARLGEGLVRMQQGDARQFPHGAFLSWSNTWHGWGNAQAYALLRAGKLLGRRDFTASALKEVDLFYPHLLENGMLASFKLRKADGRMEAVEVKRFPQIAYGISPMVLASVEAYRQTGRTRYLVTARQLGAWLSGRNDARRAIYDPATGRVLDGINGPGSANRDSGAESTIEGLFTLRVLEGGALP